MKKLIVRVVIILFVTLLAGSFLGSLKQSSEANRATHQAVLASQREKESLELELKQRQHELTLASEPLNQEKLIRDTNMYKNPGETNLDLATFSYQAQSLPPTTETDLDYRASWSRLFDPLAHFHTYN